MNVADILSNKGNKIYSVDKDAPLREAINLLNARNIGVVLVTDQDGALCGILSERDIIRKSLTQEGGFRDDPVHKTMTAKVKTVDKSHTVDAVMNIMSDMRIRHMPVVQDGQLCGLVSIGDVVKRKISQAENEAAAMRDYINAG